jgi:hypothetical protein
MLEHLRRSILNRKLGVTLGPSATQHELVEILDSNEKEDENNRGVTQQLIEVALKVLEVTTPMLE